MRFLSSKKLHFVLVLAILISQHFFSKPALAASEFSTTYDAEYEVAGDGQTLVTEKITVKNLTDRYYISHFSLKIGSTTVTEAKAFLGQEELETKVDVEGNKSIIHINFKERITGLDKTQTFVLKYKSKDFASEIGNVWEINLPKIPTSEDVENYTLTLSVPGSFSDPVLIYPNPSSQLQTKDHLKLTFAYNELKKGGVSLTFGTAQLVNFSLWYHLNNQSLFSTTTSVVLPPDLKNQKIFISKIQPAPLNVTTDEDGNYLAWFRISGRNNLAVNIEGKAKIDNGVGVKDKLSADQKLSYLKHDIFWEKDNPQIDEILREIFKDTKPATTESQVKAVYKYVVGFLKYDPQRVQNNQNPRLGAATILSTPNNASDVDFTDLFITLCRQLGIPARRLDGFVFTNNATLRPAAVKKKYLHIWPEYYDDKKGWVMVDPTWEQTTGGVNYFDKFDLDHFVLGVIGTSSKGPIVSSDVDVDITSEGFSGAQVNSLDVEVPLNFWAGIPSQFVVKIANKGGTAQPAGLLHLSSAKLVLDSPSELYVSQIPPFGYATYSVKTRTKSALDSFEDTIVVSFAKLQIERRIIVKPLLSFVSQVSALQFVPAILIIVIVGGYLTVFNIHFFYQRTKKKGAG